MQKKIFISYSWGTNEHQEWVLNLAKRLMNDGVEVVLDKWDLHGGHDVFEFMESMVKSEDISKVLIICDKNYQIKSNNRDGGVGAETQIITPEIYSNQKQEKFIPIVAERDENGKVILPTYLASRKYFDLSKVEYFEDGYEELLRNILEAPALPKPKVGKIPSYITESSRTDNQTNFILRSLENQLTKNPEKINSSSKEFIEIFLDNLWNYEFKSTSRDINAFGVELVNNLHSYKDIREDFIQFLEIVTKPEFSLDTDLLINFFEQAPQYNKPKDLGNGGSYSPSNYDNFKIIFHELFIYTIAVCIKNSNYVLAGDLLYSGYYYEDDYMRKDGAKNYCILYGYHENLQAYYSRGFNKVTGFGELVITNLSPRINKMTFILADTICHYISELHFSSSYENWFPLTHLYKLDNDFNFFKRLTSKRHFEKVKHIFNVSNENELKIVLNAYKNKNSQREKIRYSSGGFNTIPFIDSIIDISKVGTER